jgi:hypothetical protein
MPDGAFGFPNVAPLMFGNLNPPGAIAHLESQ